jgi:hypothetical protein
VHEPVVPTVVQDGALRLPGPPVIEKLITVPLGAFVNPDPSFTFTCPVNVRAAVPTSLFAGANGEIWTFASTQILVASSVPFGPCPTAAVLESLSRLTVRLLGKEMLTEA